MDEEVTAEMVDLLADLDDQVADGDLLEMDAEHYNQMLKPVGRAAGEVYAEALAEGRRPAAGDVASTLVLNAHGEAFPGLLHLFETYTQSERYEGDDDWFRVFEYHIMAMGALLAADASAAAEVEEIVAGADDAYAAYLEDWWSRDSNSLDLRDWIDSFGDEMASVVNVSLAR